MSELEIEGIPIISGIEKIQEGALFRGLTYDETLALAGVCRVVNTAAGEMIIEENAVAEALYLVVSGEVEVFTGAGVEKKTLAVLRSGEGYDLASSMIQITLGRSSPLSTRATVAASDSTSSTATSKLRGWNGCRPVPVG